MLRKKLYSVTEVCELLGIGKNKVYELIKYGYLQAIDLGGLKVPDVAIDRFIDTYIGYSFKDLSAVTKFEFAV